MHSLTCLNGGDSFNPGVRQIFFDNDPPQYTTAHLLNHAWTAERSTSECTQPPAGDVSTWMREAAQLTKEERNQLPQNPDTKTYNTPWRNQVYYLWNHVFYDVGNWMARMYGTRRFMPPNTEVFTLSFPTPHEDEDGGKVPALTKVWDTETLLIPAYLAPGVFLRVETLEPGQEEGATLHTGNFEPENRYTAWYVTKGLQLRFYVEGDWDQRTGGMAAVMVYGKMLGEPLDEIVSESEESEAGTDDEDKE